jgi:predicted nucleotidyltransferase
LLDLTKIPNGFLDPITRVVGAILDKAGDLVPDDVMLVGASCRDVLHTGLGHTFATTATQDLDVALALSSWDAYRAIARSFQKIEDTGIRFRIVDIAVDLLPFGAIEDPQGFVEPPSRQESMSVWAFDEIFAASLPLPLSPTTTIRIPTASGFTAAKLGAWLDRSAWRETKDAADLALTLHWYNESAEITDRLYETAEGNAILVAEGSDLLLSAAHLLGRDVAETIGRERVAELLSRWPGDRELLVRELTLRGGPAWPQDLDRRRNIVDALTRGLKLSNG